MIDYLLDYAQESNVYSWRARIRQVKSLLAGKIFELKSIPKIHCCHHVKPCSFALKNHKIVLIRE